MPPLPVARDAASAAFFDGTARGELMLRRCEDCTRIGPPPTQTCASCGSARLGWTPAQGTGTLVSWTVVHGRPAADGRVTRTVAGLVELAEGPWLHARITDIAPGDVTAGLPLGAGFCRSGDGEAVPVFHPLAPRSGDAA
ncbi:Zn-ribbon domain-containing OB-fold protein [Streptomyces sp. C10-9-1]|uniref:Zn-ribbon domain-containing OB-fold protein n=1 Tax=Streptomyces sp. C10-9-1 TaxID=1859285 RepID=UPI003D7288FD